MDVKKIQKFQRDVIKHLSEVFGIKVLFDWKIVCTIRTVSGIQTYFVKTISPNEDQRQVLIWCNSIFPFLACRLVLGSGM